MVKITLGDLAFLSVPGEVLPKLGDEILSKVPEKHGLLLGLGNDELGYIIHPEDWDNDLYKYERSMSVGPLMGETLLKNVP